MRHHILLFFCLAVSMPAFAQEVKRGETLVIKDPGAEIYSGPNESMHTNSKIAAGRRVRAASNDENGFVALATKSGRAWVKTSSVATEPVIVDAEAAPPRETATRFPFGIERMTFDLGGSFGSVNGFSYTEVSLGLNSYFSDYLAWRNAVFGRFVSQHDNVFGLDTSLRGIYSSVENRTGFTLFAGPGYRIATGGLSAPFVEGGLIVRVGGFSIGGGVKSLLNSVVKSGADTDTQYFLILAGGGAL